MPSDSDDRVSLGLTGDINDIYQTAHNLIMVALTSRMQQRTQLFDEQLND